MQLAAIREARTAKVAEARTLLDANKTLTPEQQTAFDKLKGEITSLEADEQRAAFIEAAERRALGEPVGDHAFAAVESRVNLGDVLRSQLEGRALTGAAAEAHAEIERRTGRKAQGVFLPMSLFETRVNTTTSGANLVGTDHRGDQFIPALRNSLLARRLGVRVLSGLRGDVSIPKHGSSTTNGWVAENSGLTPSDMTFGNVGLTPKHVGSLSEMSRQLIQQSDPTIEQLLRDDMAFGIAQSIDSALIQGGGANEPSGVIDTLGTANGTLAGPTWEQVLAIIQAVEEDNAISPSHAWLTNPAGKAKLGGTLKVSGDAGGGFLLQGGRMAEHPLFSTNQVAGDSNGSSIIFGDWSQVMLGIWSELDVLVNPYDSTAYARGGVLVRAMATCDIAIRHPEAFVWSDDL